MKFNTNSKKTLVFLMLGIVAIGIATAGIISYYGSIDQDISVEQPIKVNNEVEYAFSSEIDAFSGDTVYGDFLNISNTGNGERSISVMTNHSEGIDDVSYISYMELSTKDVNFSENVWEETDDMKATVKYTVKGDEFSAEVVEGEKEGYKLYYYADNADRFDNVSKLIPVEDIGSQSLPYSDDENAEGGDYNYCDTGEYNTCNGAKLWYVPTTAEDNGEVDWSQADNFLFETKLIQYNTEGNFIAYPDTTTSLTPVYEINELSQGTENVETTILP